MVSCSMINPCVDRTDLCVDRTIECTTSLKCIYDECFVSSFRYLLEKILLSVSCAEQGHDL